MKNDDLLLIGLISAFLISLAIFIIALKYRLSKKKSQTEAEKTDELSENPFNPLNQDYNLQSLVGTATICIILFIYILSILFK